MHHKFWLALSIVALAPAGAILVARQQPSPQELRLVQEIRLGDASAKPEYLFVGPNELAIGRDSSILVEDGLQIRQFSSTGQHIRTFGRSGSGPGEFRIGVGFIGFLGDTVYAIDIFSRRITLFSAGGEVLQTTSFAAGINRTTLFGAHPRVLLSDGSAVGRAIYSGEAEASGRVPRVPYLRSTRAGEILDTILWVTAPRVWPPGSPRMHPDLADNPLVTIAPNGTRIVVVDRVAPTGDRVSSFTVTSVNMRGETLFKRSYDYSPRSVSRARRDSIVARARGVQDSTSAAVPPTALVSEFIRSIPTHYPPVSEVVVGYDGSIWLRREPGGTDWTWDILSPNGARTAVVRTPKNTELLAVDRQSVWVVERDSLDVPTLVRYRTAPR